MEGEGPANWDDFDENSDDEFVPRDPNFFKIHIKEFLEGPWDDEDGWVKKIIECWLKGELPDEKLIVALEMSRFGLAYLKALGLVPDPRDIWRSIADVYSILVQQIDRMLHEKPELKEKVKEVHQLFFNELDDM